MALRFGLRGSYLDNLKKHVLPEGGMAMAGGALGGLAFGLIQQQKFFQDLLMEGVAADKQADRRVMKQIGLALVLGVAGGSGLWMGGSMGQNAAKGLMGAMGATMAAVLWNRFATKDAAKYVQLQGTRTYQGGVEQLPAGVASGGRLGSGVQVQSRHAYDNKALMSVLA